MRKCVLCHMQTKRSRSACASAQSDQRLCCSLPRPNDTSSLYIRNSKILADLCSWAGQFVSCLVGDSRRHIFSWHDSYIVISVIVLQRIVRRSDLVQVVQLGLLSDVLLWQCYMGKSAGKKRGFYCAFPSNTKGFLSHWLCIDKRVDQRTVSFFHWLSCRFTQVDDNDMRGVINIFW